MKKFLTLVAIIAVMVATIAASAPQPKDTVTIASGADSSYITIHESYMVGSGWDGDYTDIGKVETGNISNLANFSVGLWAGCDGDGGTDGWNNCITGVEYHIRAGSCVGIWKDSAYGGTRLMFEGTRLSADDGEWIWKNTASDNVASSIKWGDWKYVATSSGYQCVWGSW